MHRFLCVAVSLLWLSASSRGPWGVEAADFLGALSDLTLGAGMIEDLAGSVVAATEIPSLSDLGEALRAVAGLDSEQLQQLTQEQRQHVDLAQSFFLSPFGVSLNEMRGLPRLAADLTGVEGVTSRSSSSSSSALPKLPFSLRGYGVDTAELERLAEAIAEGVANSTSLGLRNNPLAPAAAAAAAAARKAAGVAAPSVEKRQEDGGSAGAPAPAVKLPTTATAAVANLMDPLGLFNLPQQASLHRKQLELQAELQKTLSELKNEQQLKQQLEEQQQQLEQQQQRLEEQQQLLQQHQQRQQLQQQLLLEQEKEKQLLAQTEEAGLSGEAAGRELFGVRLGSEDRQQPEAAAAAAAGGAGAAAAEAAPGTATAAASKAAAEGARPASSSANAPPEASGWAPRAGAAEEAGEEASSSSSPQQEAEEGEEGEEGEKKSPQRFWSRTNPFGPLQPKTDMLYLLNWSLLNPLAIIEWKKYSFSQCMDIYNDPNLCASYYLKVEPNALNHGGLNSPWENNTEE